ncbi:Invertase inhibitor [Rhynchospora pubera]|uniref:Invertase inhibitor n=1 Tax=Rhynchospora pubera TaxID=906938 RepID=A0AAV8HQF2_9POAL|nr:Invertase inhibitor [Rhynchospora pubera]
MRTFCYLLLISLFTSLSNASIVEETCKNISSSHHNIAYDFCVSSLQSYNATSQVADERTLAIIASRLANSSAAKTEARIQELMDKEKNQPRKNRLDVCMEEYSNAIDELGNAEQAIDAERDTDAQIFLSAALDAASNCEDAFAEAEDACPLEMEDGEYGQMAAIALAIVAGLRR